MQGDDSYKSIWLKSHFVFFNFKQFVKHISGFRSLSDQCGKAGQIMYTKRREEGYEHLREQYKKYKENYMKFLQFDPGAPNQSILLFILIVWTIRTSATVLEHAPLESVHIFFDTATYDEIKRDVKVDFVTFCIVGKTKGNNTNANTEVGNSEFDKVWDLGYGITLNCQPQIY